MLTALLFLKSYPLFISAEYRHFYLFSENARKTQNAITSTHTASTDESTNTFFRSPAFADFTTLPIIHGIMNAAISERYCNNSSIAELKLAVSYGSRERKHVTDV